MKKIMLLGAALAAAVGLAEAPATATWTGGGDHAVLTDPANWECLTAGGILLRDAIPDASTTVVTVNGNTSFNCPLGTAPIWRSISIGSVTLTDDCDWRGAGDSDIIAAGATIDMAGHNLHLRGRYGSADRRINVTDSSATGGELHFYVAEGETYNNRQTWGSTDVIWYSGSLKFVKDGPGTYEPAWGSGITGYQFYNYTGGTVIHEGRVYLTNDGEGTANETYYAQNNRPMFGANGGFIQIDADGELDYKGIYDIGNHYTPFILNGGTLSNSRAPARPDYGAIRDVRLLADSSMSFTRDAHLEGPWTLNCHTLSIDTVADSTLYCRAATITEGTVKVTGDGWFRVYLAPIVASDNVTLDIASPLNVETNLTVHTYIARYEGDLNAGTGQLNVTGRFQPVTECFYPATLRHGATLDLSTKTGVWSTTGEFGTLQIADDSMITIDVGSRSLANGDRIVAWDRIPAAGCSFRIVSSTLSNESPRVDDTGVYVDIGDTSVVRIAHWTGAAGNSSFDDPGNWACTNSIGAAIAGVPGDQAVVYLRRINFDQTGFAALRAKIAGYQAFYLDPVLSLERDYDLRLFSAADLETIDGHAIMLNGHRLQIAGADGVSAAEFTVTDAEENGGTFEIEVPEGATFVNETIALTGTVKLEKSGPGTMVQNKFGHTYSGGTLVSGGMLKSYNDDVADSSGYSPNDGRTGFGVFGTRGTPITVGPGAVFDINGVYDLCNFEWHLAGGTMINTKRQSKYNWGGWGNVVLEADSEIDFDLSTVIYTGNNPFDLQGHTLTLNLAEGINCYFNTMTMSNGTLVVVGKGKMDIYQDFNTQNLTLDVDAMPWLNGNVVVSNLIYRYAALDGLVSEGRRFLVSGAFTPVGDQFGNTAMLDGATLDLSQQPGIWNVVSLMGSLKYEPACSNIVVDVGSREIASEAQLVSWPEVPAGIKFTLKGEHVKEGDTLSCLPTGLFYDIAPDSQLVITATWTDMGEANNLNDPANWSCQNARGDQVPNGVPGKPARVYISGHFGNVLASTLADCPWQQCVIGNVMLTEDCDLRGYGCYTNIFTASSTIDLRGHKLYVTTPNGTSPTPYTVTDTSIDAEHPGELHLDVPAGFTLTNTGTTLSGNSRLVKDGGGTFTSSIFTLDYTGGNVVAEGGLTLFNNTTANSTTYAFGQTANPKPLGRHGTTIWVEDGATVDINGIYDTSRYNWVLGGGTIKNSKALTTSSWGGFGNITLTADSSVNAGTTFFINGNVDLGGNTMSLTIAAGIHMAFRSSSFRNGTLKLVSGGFIDVPAALDMRTVDLHVEDGALSISALLSVHDYYAAYNYDYNIGSGGMDVYGKFTPAGDYFYGCTMQNGSTIDLSAKTDVWSTQSLTTQEGLTTVSFADGAVVTVDIHGREFDFTGTDSVKIIAWDEENPPPSSVRFKADSASARNAIGVTKHADGLYVIRTSMALIFR